MITPVPPQPVEDLSDLARSLRRPRALFSWAMSVITGGMTIFALVPLFSVLYLLVTRGGKELGLAVFRELPPAALAPGGGFGNALVGTLVMIAIGLSICYLANAWNIGAEGQFLIGAVAGSWLAVKTQGTDAGPWVLPAMLLLGVIGGALVGVGLGAIATRLLRRAGICRHRAG